MLTATLFVLLLLIAVNALYVAAEFAAVSVRKARVRQAAENGNYFARKLLPVLAQPRQLDDYIAACQIGITLSSLVAGAYGQARLSQVLRPMFEGWGGMQAAGAESTAALVVLIGLTVFQMTLGELLPKSVALRLPTQTAFATVVPMRWSLVLLRWFIRVLNGSGAWILRRLGVRVLGHGHIHSPSEIEYLVVESRHGGLLSQVETRRLRRALKLSVNTAAEVMVPRVHVVALDVTSTLDEARALLDERPFTRVPVYEESIDRIVGLVHARDVVIAVHDEASGAGGGGSRDGAVGVGGENADGRALSRLVRPILVVPQSLTMDRLLARMRAEHRTMAVLLDEYGGTAGIVTMGDILDALIGGLADEFKGVGPQAEVLLDGRVRLPGALPLHEALDAGVPWESSAHTVAGYLLDELQRLPDEGEVVEAGGVSVLVEKVTHHAIASVLVKLPEPDEEGEDA
ncbi:MAG TPA: hemolysin family protein [Gemmatimonadales bacterium]|nr:hemolysin family protein [Gemmatimonadales bacterium]